MRGKMWFLGGLAAGFVLGARAGRERYNELVVNARKVWDHPTVQEAAGVVQAQANRLYSEGKDTVSDKLGQTKVGEKLGARKDQPDGLASASESRPDAGPRSSTNNATF
jgi:hypothetical protein